MTASVVANCQPHHWLLPTPNGPTLEGVCKKCGETRVYWSSEQTLGINPPSGTYPDRVARANPLDGKHLVFPQNHPQGGRKRGQGAPIR